MITPAIDGRLTSVTLRSAIGSHLIARYSFLAKVRQSVSINATDAHKKANRRYRAVFAFVGFALLRMLAKKVLTHPAEATFYSVKFVAKNMRFFVTAIAQIEF